MSEDGNSPDGEGNNVDPNTPRELRKARDDAKRYREEAERRTEEVARLTDDLKVERKAADGLRGKLKQTENDFAAKLEARDKQEDDLRAAHRKELAEREVKEASATAAHAKELDGFRAREGETKTAFEDASSKSKAERDELVMSYELRNTAIKNGVVDENDLVKLLDRSSLKMDKEGKITGIAELIEQAKTDKPYLFKQPAAPLVLDTSSNTRRTPDPNHKPKDAMEMTPEDYRIERARIAGGASFN